MKKYLFLLFMVVCGTATAQSVVVPHNVYFAGMHLQLNESGRREIQKKVDALLQHPEYFRRKVEVADMYFPIIERIFKEENLPDDFKFLALQESGLVSDAVSKSNAVGFWQFKQEAAFDFGLKINQSVDERKHIIESTRGAAKYMHRSNNYYKNWFNTILSYYLGYTGAKSATKTSDIGASKMEVTDKTHEYQLTFLAHKIAFENFVGKSAQLPVVLQEHKARGGQTLSEIALISKTDLAELERYNKWLSGGTVPNDKTYTVMIPVTNPEHQALLAAKTNPVQTVTAVFAPEKLVSEKALLTQKNGVQAIVARKGDTKDRLAMQAGLSTRRFLKLNDMRTFDPIIEGEAYYVKPKKNKSETEFHIVQPGDRLIGISQQYGVKLNAILKFNRMKKTEALAPGRVLWLREKRPANVPVEYRRQNQETAKTAATPAVTPAPATATKTEAAPAKTEQPKPVAAETPAPRQSGANNFFRKVGSLFKVEPKRERVQEVSRTAVYLDVEPEEEKTAAVPVSSPTPAPVQAPAPVPAPATPAPAVSEAKTATPQLPAPDKAAPARQTASPVAGDPNADEREDGEEIIRFELPAELLAETEETAAAEANEPASEAQPVKLQEPVATLPTETQPAPAPEASPAKAIPAAPAPVKAPEPAPAQPATKATTHKVNKGETLYAIAKKYDLAVEDLKTWNKLSNGALSIGQTIQLVPPAEPAQPAAKPAEPAAGQKSSSHTVKPGETLYAISRLYDLTVEDLKAWNQLSDAPLTVGQTLKLSGPATATTIHEPASEVTASTGKTVVHTVAAGESMYQISRKYGVTIKDIMEWNRKSDFDVKPGEMLTIHPKASEN